MLPVPDVTRDMAQFAVTGAAKEMLPDPPAVTDTVELPTTGALMAISPLLL